MNYDNEHILVVVIANIVAEIPRHSPEETVESY